ncbi:hypothetical protein [Rossellomorea aquimaris]|uniref:Uncharacterized protein n=1 Tax=Rossellomorea aquimaris TaxID=189382 RepID=A0A366EJD4_9BACI|nr:hypothetical protein [Rossellomorea aquimaris]RBP02493.1 hypothetical protein DET59_11456 [Rossellomorea aquimaris]
MEHTVWMKNDMVDHDVFREPGDLRMYVWILIQAGPDGEYIHQNGRMIREWRESLWYYNGKKLDWYSTDWIKRCLKRLEKHGLIRVVENGVVLMNGDGEGQPEG